MSNNPFIFESGSFKVSVHIASVTGALHLQENKPNEDAYTFYSKDNFFSLAVADGLGSCGQSRIGARYAVDELGPFIETIMQNGRKTVGKSDIMQYIKSWREHFGDNVSAYDTTLQFVIGMDGKLTFVSIGDGGISFLSEQFYQHPRYEQTFANVTHSIAHCHEHAITITSMNIVEGTIMIATDGVTNDLHEEQLPQFLAYVAQQIQIDSNAFQLELEAWLTNWETSKHMDDRTIGFITIRKKDKHAPAE